MGSDWRPIETAPDGHCLVWLPIKEQGSHVHAMTKGKITVIAGLLIWDLESEPTHWMPLPDPPA